VEAKQIGVVPWQVLFAADSSGSVTNQTCTAAEPTGAVLKQGVFFVKQIGFVS
jgi:hypothetical protein